MKKLILTAFVVAATTAFAQTETTPYELNVNLKSGETVKYTVNDIESLTFTGGEPIVTTKAYRFTAPATFKDSYVYKVMAEGKQVAEVNMEYVKAANAQLVVAYPCGEDGKADLTKGIASTGQTVVWDLTANTATVGAATAAVTEYFLVDGELMTTYSGEATDATVVADILSDRRGTEINTYPIVKIGTQYWMGSNLRATFFTDGTPIACIGQSDSDGWKNNTTGAYLSDPETDWVKVAGYFYNGYCVTSTAGIAPEGWEVPTDAQYKLLRSAGNLAGIYFKDSAFGTWSEGMTGTNLNLFTAVGTGSYTGSSTQSPYSDAYFWTSTLGTNWLKKECLATFRIAGANKTSSGSNQNTVVSTIDNGHTLNFGHTIRCVRK